MASDISMVDVSTFAMNHVIVDVGSCCIRKICTLLTSEGMIFVCIMALAVSKGPLFSSKAEVPPR